MLLPDFLLSDSMRKAREDRMKREVERRLAACAPWDPLMKWKPELNILADTYKPFSLFLVRAVNSNDCNDCTSAQAVLSPNKKFLYCEKKLKRGDVLETVYGRDKGTVLFDGPVVIPALHDMDSCGTRWRVVPWMSLTPMEIFTLRNGTKLAKGTTAVVGLGLGHQLIEVSRRKQVKKIILVEESRELVDWLLPRIRLHMARPVDEVIIGDAYKELPKMKGVDVALVDIFKGYGSNHYRRDELRRQCFGIKHIWAWGTADLRAGGGCW
jgi:hypothetical protein